MADERPGRRERLIERIRLLPADRLPYVEKLVSRLECSEAIAAFPRGDAEYVGRAAGGGANWGNPKRQ
jgi:hypothetical protein